MSSCVINVKKRMKEEAYLKISNRVTKEFNLSAEAVQENISFLNAEIECRMQVAMELAFRDGRKTVMPGDIIQAYGVRL